MTFPIPSLYLNNDGFYTSYLYFILSALYTLTRHSLGTLMDPGMMPYSLSSQGSLTSMTTDARLARSCFSCLYVTSVLGGPALNLLI